MKKRILLLFTLLMGVIAGYGQGNFHSPLDNKGMMTASGKGMDFLVELHATSFDADLYDTTGCIIKQFLNIECDTSSEEYMEVYHFMIREKGSVLFYFYYYGVMVSRKEVKTVKSSRQIPVSKNRTSYTETKKQQ